MYSGRMGFYCKSRMFLGVIVIGSFFLMTASVSQRDVQTLPHKSMHRGGVRELPAEVLSSTNLALPEVITWSLPTPFDLPHVQDGTIKPVIKASSGVWCESTPTNCCALGCSCYQRTPQSVVNKIGNLYSQNQELYGSNPAILLQEIGMGGGDPCPQQGIVQHWMYADGLFLNWCDQIKPDENNPCDPPSHESARWLSPWNDNGIEQMKSWISSFLNSYQVRINNGTLPMPSRFVFDTEYWPMAPYWGENGITAFRDLAGLNVGEEPDSRWDTKVLPVFNKTLKELYDEAIANGMTDPIPGNWAIEENHSWVLWYDGIMSTMCDAAMKEAFFDPIQEFWPSVVCSNFDTSISADGLQSIPGSPPRVFRNRRHQSATWFTLVQRGSSDEQAAEMYAVSELHLQENEEHGLAWARVHRANLEACIESYDGFTLDEIMPWIPLIGTPFVNGWDGGVEWPDKWSVRNLIAMFKSKGIKKFFIWSISSYESSQNWREFNDLVDQVWLSELNNYTINTGVSELDAISKLRISDWNWKEEHAADVLSITSENTSSGYEIECDLQFETAFDCSQTRGMQLMIDARLEGDLTEFGDEATLAFSMQNTLTGDWVPIEEVVVDVMWFDMSQDKWVWEEVNDPSVTPIDQRRVVIHVPIELSRYWINELGEVNIRLAGQSPNSFTLLLDAATVFETDELPFSENCLSDCAPAGGDGVVDLHDLLFIISEYGLTNSPADVYPNCGDGEVQVQDVIQVIQSWGQPCQ